MRGIAKLEITVWHCPGKIIIIIIIINNWRAGASQLNHTTGMIFLYIYWRAGASQLNRTTGTIFLLYIYIYIYIYLSRAKEHSKL